MKIDDPMTEQTEALRAALHELHTSPVMLAKMMVRLGDRRSLEVISRGIKRMLAGETRVSGEMLVIANLLVWRRRQILEQYADLEWRELPNGSFTAVAGEFKLNLHPETRGRWIVQLVHLKTGYSPPWPEWQDSLGSAKQKAIFCLDEAYRAVKELEAESLAN